MVNTRLGGACVVALGRGELSSENDERRRMAEAGAELLAGIAGDLRRLRVGFIG